MGEGFPLGQGTEIHKRAATLEGGNASSCQSSCKGRVSRLKIEEPRRTGVEENSSSKKKKATQNKNGWDWSRRIRRSEREGIFLRGTNLFVRE